MHRHNTMEQFGRLMQMIHTVHKETKISEDQYHEIVACIYEYCKHNRDLTCDEQHYIEKYWPTWNPNYNPFYDPTRIRYGFAFAHDRNLVVEDAIATYKSGIKCK